MTNITPLADRLAQEATKQHEITLTLIASLQQLATLYEEQAKFWEGKV